MSKSLIKLFLPFLPEICYHYFTTLPLFICYLKTVSKTNCFCGSTPRVRSKIYVKTEPEESGSPNNLIAIEHSFLVL